MHDTLASTIATFEETLGARGGALVNALTAQTRQLDEQLNSLAALVGDGGDSVVERIGAHATRLGESIGAHVEAIDAIMSNRQAELDDRLTDHHARFEEASNARLTEFENASVAHRTVVELALSTHARVVDDSVRDGVANFEATFAQHGQQLVSRLDAETELLTTRARVIDDSVRDKLTNFETTFAERGQDLVSRLDAETKSLATQLDGKLSAIEETIVTRGGALDERLGKRNQEAAALFDAGMQAADHRATAKLQEIAATQNELLQRIDSGLAARGKALNETLAKSTIEAAKTLSEGGREITQGISAKSTEIDGSAVETLDADHRDSRGQARRHDRRARRQRRSVPEPGGLALADPFDPIRRQRRRTLEQDFVSRDDPGQSRRRSCGTHRLGAR
jgi:DNA anti-recombination protein RmuC